MRQSRPTQPPVTSPRLRRRRRQQSQQVRCCGCVLLLVALVAGGTTLAGRLGGWSRARRAARLEAEAYHFPLTLEVQGRRFYRYQRVPITLRLYDAQGQPVRTDRPPPVTVWLGKEPVVTVGNLQKLTPRYRPQTQDYVCYWPIPRVATPGRYTLSARMEIPDTPQWDWTALTASRAGASGAEPPPQGPAHAHAQATIEIVARPPPPFAPGTCFATWEENFPTGAVPLPDGSRGDWRAMFGWAKFLGADTLLFRGAVTDARGGELSARQPFVARNLEAIPGLGAEAHRRGLRFGVWAVGYETLPKGTLEGKPPYQYAQDISRSTRQTHPLDFISLLDPQRPRDLADFLRWAQADPHVDFVGLDYIRGDVGGWEMIEAFTEQMPVPLPADWEQRDEKQRWLWMANKIEVEWQQPSGRDVYDLWNWWRAHLTSEIIARLVREGELHKPLFLFVLSWQHGLQHGQDPAMFTDAGATVLMPMLYQVSSQRHFEIMMRQWHEYLGPGQANLAPGNQVDDYWHQRSRNPATPELLYQRMVTAQEQMIREGRPVGAFWHDISRAAVRGTLGPYPGTEWALAGAAAFSRARQGWGVYPLRFGMTGPDAARFGAPFTLRLSVENTSQVAVRDLTLRLEQTQGVQAAQQRSKTIASLGPGEKIEVPLPVVISAPEAARGNRFMVAVRAEWPARDYGPGVRSDLPRTFVLMQYVQASAGG